MKFDDNKQYFIDKISKEKDIDNLLREIPKEQVDDFLKDIQKIWRILHINERNDKIIFNEYEKLIKVSECSEKTLVKELNEFNHNFYKDKLPQHYISNFDSLTAEYDDEISINNNMIEDILSQKNPTIVNEFKRSPKQPIIDNETILFDDLSINEIEKNLKKNIPNEKEPSSLTNIINSSANIIVASEEEKIAELKQISQNLNKRLYGKLNLSKKMLITSEKYTKKLEELKERFKRTYGSEIFKKIAEWIDVERKFYKNE